MANVVRTGGPAEPECVTATNRRDQPDHFAGGNEADQPREVEQSEARHDRRREGTGTAKARRDSEQRELVCAVGAKQRIC